MRLLGVLGLGLVDLHRLGQGLVAEVPGDDLAQLGRGFLRQRGGVGTHVGDQADVALFADRHALVQPLRHAHGAAGGETELARGLLLQRGGGERRRRATLALAAADLADRQLAIGRLLQRFAGGMCRALVGQVELFELLAVKARELGAEFAVGMPQIRLDGPVFARIEGFDLLLALDDHAQRRALHATGGQAALHLAPQHRRQVEADQVVQRAARLLGIDQVDRKLARMLDRRLDGARGDLAEHHPVHVLAVEQAVGAQDLADVPGNGLALAIQIGGEIDGVGHPGRFLDGVDVFLVALDHVVLHGEAVLGIDRALLGHQVTDMTVGGQDREVLAEVLVDRLGLGGRLDDEQVLGHSGTPLVFCWVRETRELPRTHTYI